MKTGNPRPRDRGRLAGTITAALIAVALIAGCQSSDSGAGSSGIASLGESSKESVIAPGMVIPSLTDLTPQLHLTGGQAARMGAALADWSAAVAARRALREQRRSEGRDSRRDRDGDRPDRTSPMRDFLVAGANILSTEQFVALAGILKERREAINAARAARRTDRKLAQDGRFGQKRDGRGGFGEKLRDELNLTGEQHTAVQSAFGEMRQTMQVLRPERGSGVEPDRKAIQSAREKLHAAIENILTPEQAAEWQYLRNTRREQQQAKRQQRAEDRRADHLAFLTALLDLDPAQQTAIDGIMADARSERRAIHEAAGKEGAVPDGSLREGMQEIAEASQVAIREVLSPEKAEVFDAVSDLLLHNGKGRGHRGFRGHGMNWRGAV